MPTATTAPPRILPAGEYQAQQVPLGAHVLVGTRDIGRVIRVESRSMVHPDAIDAVRTGFTREVPGQPILKFEIACSGGRTYYFARFPHEPVQIVEV